METAPLRGERLTALRHLHGLSQTQLAAELSVTQPFLSLVERSERAFPETLAAAASGTYRIPRSFFTVPPEPSDAAPVTFRKKAAVSAQAEDRVVQTFREASRLFRYVSEQSGYKASELPDAGEFNFDPAACADAVRSQLGVDRDAPILNVTRALERLGVGVLERLEERAERTSGHVSVSRPLDATGRPLAALIEPDLPGAVQRLSLAHELGHLILDQGRLYPIASTRSAEERRAYAFAGAFLIPDHVVRAEVSETLTLHGYLRIKAQFGISVAALIMRARDLGVLSPTRARSLQIQLSSQGWRTQEPVEVEPERAQLFAQAYRRVFVDRPPGSVADEIGQDPALLAVWMASTADVQRAGPTATIINLNDRRRVISGALVERHEQ